MTPRSIAMTSADRLPHRSVDSTTSGRRLRVLGGLSAALLAWLAIGGMLGLAAGVVLGPMVGRMLGRLEPAAIRRERQAVAADLPFAADLVAAALRAGLPMEAALRTVGSAIRGPVGRDLICVADGLDLGLDPAIAWNALRGTAGGVRMADAVARTADSGAAIARSLERLAEDLRAARSVSVDGAAQRVGVLIVLPLGLCFLPAFVLAGIVPVIVAVLGGVLR